MTLNRHIQKDYKSEKNTQMKQKHVAIFLFQLKGYNWYREYRDQFYIPEMIKDENWRLSFEKEIKLCRQTEQNSDFGKKNSRANLIKPYANISTS